MSLRGEQRPKTRPDVSVGWSLGRENVDGGSEKVVAKTLLGRGGVFIEGERTLADGEVRAEGMQRKGSDYGGG